jgi:hypothetical protein
MWHDAWKPEQRSQSIRSLLGNECKQQSRYCWAVTMDKVFSVGSVQIFYMIDLGDIPSIQCKMSPMERKSMRKTDLLSLIFIDFYVPALTPRPGSTENITLFAVVTYSIYRCHKQWDLDRHQVFREYNYIYTLYSIYRNKRANKLDQTDRKF